MTYTEWKAEGQRRFGKNKLNWRFVCPSCGHIASVQDWRDAGAPDGAVTCTAPKCYKDSSRAEWIHCVGFGYGICIDGKKTWCGRNEIPFFTDPTHAALNGIKEGRLVVCAECVTEICKALKNGHDETPNKI